MHVFTFAMRFPVTSSAFVLLFLFSICFSNGGVDGNKPEQIHIAFTGIASERNVNYVTPSPDEKPETIVMYGTSPDNLDKKATGDSFVFQGPGHRFTIHNVKVGRSRFSIFLR